MKLFNKFCGAVLFFCSLNSVAWEIQQAKICEGVGLHAGNYILCFPKHYFVDVVTKERVGLMWTTNKPTISFSFSDYKELLEKDQEDGRNIYQTKTSINGEIVYIHHLSFPGTDIKTYTWTYVVEENELYMQIIGLSAAEVSGLFNEIMKSKKMH
jgi:hypothetical protein